jgi:aminoglycoside phosphotransferase (APT) family kinase protein
VSDRRGDDTALVRRLLAAHGHPADEVRPLGAGLEHTAYAAGDLVVRLALEPDPDEVAREARLLVLVAGYSPVPVPRPVFTVPEVGCLAYRRLPGTPLLDAPRDPAAAAPIGTVLGRLLAALRAVPADRLSGLAGTDDDPPAAWLEVAQDAYPDLADHLPPGLRPALEAFLGTAPPPAPATRVFSHNDLGIEHVLTRGAEVTGVIDWSDAAVTDPAHDLGRLLRDLGPAALDAALAQYPDPDPGLRDRARFVARCALLEDLAHGLATGRDAYTRKSLDAVAWLFPTGPE